MPWVLVICTGATLVAGRSAHAGDIYQPPGANLTYGDVTHGQRVRSSTSNPAAAAADLALGEGRGARGLVFSGSAGLEYGNIENLFEFYNDLTRAYEPSDPGSGGGGPGQDPDDKPDGGIDLGLAWDNLDPAVQAAVEAAAQEVARQAILLSIIRNQGYGRAWLAADVPFQFGTEFLGGAWTFSAGWSGSSRAFGIVENIRFDSDAARLAIDNWLAMAANQRPAEIPLSEDVLININSAASSVGLLIRNDSSIVSKSSQLTEVNFGYSDQAWSNENGSLFLGAEAHVYSMRLSRLSVRFGDISDSEALFDEIKNAEFETDSRLSFDAGVLWVASNYQLGAQVTNINEPTFQFPDLNLNPYSSNQIIGFLERDQTYQMDRQVKLEASLFTDNRRWSAHLGVDANDAADGLGDEYQWVTLSAGYTNDGWWVPSLRAGYRENLVGTKRRYLSLGATFFQFLNFDIASAFDAVEIDGQDLPQGLMASLGFQIAW